MIARTSRFLATLTLKPSLRGLLHAWPRYISETKFINEEHERIGQLRPNGVSLHTKLAQRPDGKFTAREDPATQALVLSFAYKLSIRERRDRRSARAKMT